MRKHIILYMVALILFLLALYAYLECSFQSYSTMMMAILGIISENLKQIIAMLHDLLHLGELW